MSELIFELVWQDNLAALNSLLDEQPELVHARDPYQWTPLHKASGASRERVAELLLRRGAEVNARGNAGESPLHLAMDVGMGRLLIAHGGNPVLEDRHGTTPLDWAARERHGQLFLELAAAAPQLGSPNYQLLRQACREKLGVEGKYRGDFNHYRVIKLGWTQGAERCLALTHSYGNVVWQCLEVCDLSDLDFARSLHGLTGPAGKPPDCVLIADELGVPVHAKRARRG